MADAIAPITRTIHAHASEHASDAMTSGRHMFDGIARPKKERGREIEGSEIKTNTAMCDSCLLCDSCVVFFLLAACDSYVV